MLKHKPYILQDEEKESLYKRDNSAIVQVGN